MFAARIEGFHRIGLTLAVICLLAGGIALLFGVYQWAEPLIKVPTFEVSNPAGKRLMVRYGTEPKAIGAKVKERYENDSDRLRAVESIDQEFGRIDLQREVGALWMLGSLVSLIGAAALYATSWAIGWVLAGFFGD